MTSLRDFLRVIFRNKKIFLITVVTVMVAVSLGLQLKTPEYESEVRMLILAKKSVDSPYYKDIPDFRSAEMTLTQTEIVKSNPVIERVAKRLRLTEIPLDYEKKFSSPLKALLIDFQVRSTRAKMKQMSLAEQRAFLLRRAIANLKASITAEPVKNTELFAIKVTDFDPQQAAKIANTVSRSYSIYDLEQQLAELQQQYGDKHQYVLQLESNIERMEESLRGDPLSNIEAIGPASVKVIEQANVPVKPSGMPKQVTLAISLFLAVALGVVLAFVADSINTTIKSPSEIETQLKLPVLGFIPKKQHIQERLISYTRIALVTICVVICLSVLFRLFGRFTGLDATNKFVTSIYTFSELFFIPLKALIKPKSNATYALYSGVTLLIFMALAVVIHKLLRRKEKSLSESAAVLQEKEKGGIYANTYRKLAENLYLALKSKYLNSILFVSPEKNTGNTTVLANLGICMGKLLNHKVLLIDANLRDPALHAKFGLDNSSGLTDVLEGNANFKQLIQSVHPSVHVLTAGKQFHEPLSLLQSEKMTYLLREAEKIFDIILIDCASLRDSIDALAISSHTQGIILLIKEGETKREVITSVMAPLKDSKANLLGAILNQRTFVIPKAIYKIA